MPFANAVPFTFTEGVNLVRMTVPPTPPTYPPTQHAQIKLECVAHKMVKKHKNIKNVKKEKGSIESCQTITFLSWRVVGPSGR